MSNTTTSETSKKHLTATKEVQLSAHNVGVAFGTEVALRGVSFTISSGEFIGLVAAFYLGIAAGGAIVLVALVFMGIAMIWQR